MIPIQSAAPIGVSQNPHGALAAEKEELLSVHDLHVQFSLPSGTVRAVEGVSFALRRGETLGIVGESGSGKSVTALAILGLIARPFGRVSGQIDYDSKDLLTLDTPALQKIRGNRIAMIFQDPMSCLNPVFTIGSQLVETVRLHMQMGGREAFDYSADMLARVGIPLPTQRMREYPHQLSGGMRQRVMIAMALACKPQILLADEPTTALDVTIQAQIVDLMLALQEETGTSILLISHDMGLVAETCDRVAVMYAGQIIESAPVADLFAAPRHPYTTGLLRSIPRLRTDRSMPRVEKLQAISGVVPSPRAPRVGCAFQPRCTQSMEICAGTAPLLQNLSAAHSARCWLHDTQPAAQVPLTS